MGNRKLIKRICLLVLAVCLLFLGYERFLSVGSQRKQEALQGQYRSKEAESSLRENAAGQTRQGEEEIREPAEPEEREDPVMSEKFAELYKENQDVVGWLSIEGMVIDYPVMQCEDNEYYLHHDFYKEEYKYGVPYVKDIADVFTPGTNFVIYAHNTKDGSMFGDLDYYKKEEFYREHRYVNFDTLYEERTYEILAVFLSRVYEDGEEGFKYYEFYRADTEEEFRDFYENIKELSLYDTRVTAEYGDTFLTMSTCAYHVENGRLVVVAKQVR